MGDEEGKYFLPVARKAVGRALKVLCLCDYRQEQQSNELHLNIETLGLVVSDDASFVFSISKGLVFKLCLHRLENVQNSLSSSGSDLKFCNCFGDSNSLDKSWTPIDSTKLLPPCGCGRCLRCGLLLKIQLAFWTSLYSYNNMTRDSVSFVLDRQLEQEFEQNFGFDDDDCKHTSEEAVVVLSRPFLRYGIVSENAFSWKPKIDDSENKAIANFEEFIQSSTAYCVLSIPDSVDVFQWPLKKDMCVLLQWDLFSMLPKRAFFVLITFEGFRFHSDVILDNGKKLNLHLDIIACSVFESKCNRYLAKISESILLVATISRIILIGWSLIDGSVLFALNPLSSVYYPESNPLEQISASDKEYHITELDVNAECTVVSLCLMDNSVVLLNLNEHFSLFPWTCNWRALYKAREFHQWLTLPVNGSVETAHFETDTSAVIIQNIRLGRLKIVPDSLEWFERVISNADTILKKNDPIYNCAHTTTKQRLPSCHLRMTLAKGVCDLRMYPGFEPEEMFSNKASPSYAGSVDNLRVCVQWEAVNVYVYESRTDLAFSSVCCLFPLKCSSNTTKPSISFPASIKGKRVVKYVSVGCNPIKKLIGIPIQNTVSKYPTWGMLSYYEDGFFYSFDLVEGPNLVGEYIDEIIIKHGIEYAKVLCHLNSWLGATDEIYIHAIRLYLKRFSFDIRIIQETFSALENPNYKITAVQLLTDHVVNFWKQCQGQNSFNNLVEFGIRYNVSLIGDIVHSTSKENILLLSALLSSLRGVAFSLNHRQQVTKLSKAEREAKIPELSFKWKSFTWHSEWIQMYQDEVKNNDNSYSVALLRSVDIIKGALLLNGLWKQWNGKSESEIVKDAILSGFISSAISFIACRYGCKTRVAFISKDDSDLSNADTSATLPIDSVDLSCIKGLTFLHRTNRTMESIPQLREQIHNIALTHVYKLLCNDQMDFMMLATKMLLKFGLGINNFLKKLAFNTTKRAVRWRLLKHLRHSIGQSVIAQIDLQSQSHQNGNVGDIKNKIYLQEDDIRNANYLWILELLYPSASFSSSYRQMWTMQLTGQYPAWVSRTETTFSLETPTIDLKSEFTDDESPDAIELNESVICDHVQKSFLWRKRIPSVCLSSTNGFDRAAEAVQSPGHKYSEIIGKLNLAIMTKEKNWKEGKANSPAGIGCGYPVDIKHLSSYTDISPVEVRKMGIKAHELPPFLKLPKTDLKKTKGEYNQLNILGFDENQKGGNLLEMGIHFGDEDDFGFRIEDQDLTLSDVSNPKEFQIEELLRLCSIRVDRAEPSSCEDVTRKSIGEGNDKNVEEKTNELFGHIHIETGLECLRCKIDVQSWWGRKSWKLGSQNSFDINLHRFGHMNLNLQQIQSWSFETRERVLIEAGFRLQQRCGFSFLKYAVEHNDWQAIINWVKDLPLKTRDIDLYGRLCKNLRVVVSDETNIDLYNSLGYKVGGKFSNPFVDESCDEQSRHTILRECLALAHLVRQDATDFIEKLLIDQLGARGIFLGLDSLRNTINVHVDRTVSKFSGMELSSYQNEFIYSTDNCRDNDPIASIHHNGNCVLFGFPVDMYEYFVKLLGQLARSQVLFRDERKSDQDSLSNLLPFEKDNSPFHHFFAIYCIRYDLLELWIGYADHYRIISDRKRLLDFDSQRNMFGSNPCFASAMLARLSDIDCNSMLESSFHKARYSLHKGNFLHDDHSLSSIEEWLPPTKLSDEVAILTFHELDGMRLGNMISQGHDRPLVWLTTLLFAACGVVSDAEFPFKDDNGNFEEHSLARFLYLSKYSRKLALGQLQRRWPTLCKIIGRILCKDYENRLVTNTKPFESRTLRTWPGDLLGFSWNHKNIVIPSRISVFGLLKKKVGTFIDFDTLFGPQTLKPIGSFVFISDIEGGSANTSNPNMSTQNVLEKKVNLYQQCYENLLNCSVEMNDFLENTCPREYVNILLSGDGMKSASEILDDGYTDEIEAFVTFVVNLAANRTTRPNMDFVRSYPAIELIEYFLSTGRPLRAFHEILRYNEGVSVDDSIGIAFNQNMLFLTCRVVALRNFDKDFVIASCYVLLSICNIDSMMLRVQCAAAKRIYRVLKMTKQDIFNIFVQFPEVKISAVSSESQLMMLGPESAFMKQKYEDQRKQEAIFYQVHLAWDTAKDSERVVIKSLRWLGDATQQLISENQDIENSTGSGHIEANPKANNNPLRLVSLFCRVHSLPPSLAMLQDFARKNDFVSFLLEAQNEEVPPQTVISIILDSFTDASVKRHLIAAVGILVSEPHGLSGGEFEPTSPLPFGQGYGNCPQFLSNIILETERGPNDGLKCILDSVLEIYLRIPLSDIDNKLPCVVLKKAVDDLEPLLVSIAASLDGRKHWMTRCWLTWLYVNPDIRCNKCCSEILEKLLFNNSTDDRRNTEHCLYCDEIQYHDCIEFLIPELLTSGVFLNILLQSFYIFDPSNPFLVPLVLFECAIEANDYENAGAHLIILKENMPLFDPWCIRVVCDEMNRLIQSSLSVNKGLVAYKKLLAVYKHAQYNPSLSLQYDVLLFLEGSGGFILSNSLLNTPVREILDKLLELESYLAAREYISLLDFIKCEDKTKDELTGNFMFPKCCTIITEESEIFKLWQKVTLQEVCSLLTYFIIEIQDALVSDGICTGSLDGPLVNEACCDMWDSCNEIFCDYQYPPDRAVAFFLEAIDSFLHITEGSMSVGVYVHILSLVAAQIESSQNPSKSTAEKECKNKETLIFLLDTKTMEIGIETPLKLLESFYAAGSRAMSNQYRYSQSFLCTLYMHLFVFKAFMIFNRGSKSCVEPYMRFNFDIFPFPLFELSGSQSYGEILNLGITAHAMHVITIEDKTLRLKGKVVLETVIVGLLNRGLLCEAKLVSDWFQYDCELLNLAELVLSIVNLDKDMENVPNLLSQSSETFCRKYFPGDCSEQDTREILLEIENVAFALSPLMKNVILTWDMSKWLNLSYSETIEKDIYDVLREIMASLWEKIITFNQTLIYINPMSIGEFFDSLSQKCNSKGFYENMDIVSRMFEVSKLNSTTCATIIVSLVSNETELIHISIPTLDHVLEIIDRRGIVGLCGGFALEMFNNFCSEGNVRLTLLIFAHRCFEFSLDEEKLAIIHKMMSELATRWIAAREWKLLVHIIVQTRSYESLEFVIDKLDEHNKFHLLYDVAAGVSLPFTTRADLMLFLQKYCQNNKVVNLPIAQLLSRFGLHHRLGCLLYDHAVYYLSKVICLLNRPALGQLVLQSACNDLTTIKQLLIQSAKLFEKFDAIHSVALPFSDVQNRANRCIIMASLVGLQLEHFKGCSSGVMDASNARIYLGLTQVEAIALLDRIKAEDHKSQQTASSCSIIIRAYGLRAD